MSDTKVFVWFWKSYFRPNVIFEASVSLYLLELVKEKKLFMTFVEIRKVDFVQRTKSLSSTHITSKSGNSQPRSTVAFKGSKITNHSVVWAILATWQTTMTRVFTGGQGTKIQKVGKKGFDELSKVIR